MFKPGDLVTVGDNGDVYTLPQLDNDGWFDIKVTGLRRSFRPDGRHVFSELPSLQRWEGGTPTQPSTPIDFATQQVSGGVKHDTGKLPWDLISVPAMDELLRVLEFGRKKYDAHNWRKGMAWTRLISAAGRHLFAFLRGEDRDPETGYLHTAHLMCCAMFLTEYALLKRGTDDRYKDAG